MQTTFPRKRRGRPPKFANVWGADSQYNKIKDENKSFKSSANSDDEERNNSEAQMTENSKLTQAQFSCRDCTVPQPPATTKTRERAIKLSKDINPSKKDTAFANDSFRTFFEAGGRDYNEYLQWVNNGVLRPNSWESNSREHQHSTTDDSLVQFIPEPLYKYNVMEMLPNEKETCLSIFLDKFQVIPIKYLTEHEHMNLDYALTKQCNGNFSTHRNKESNGTIPKESYGFNKRARCDFTDRHRSNSASDSAFSEQDMYHNVSNSLMESNMCHEQTVALDLSTRKRKGRPFQDPDRLISSPSQKSENCPSNSSKLTEKQSKKTESNKADTTKNNSGDMSLWGVEDVMNFVSSIPGCSYYTHIFVEHSIDGLTLAHLSEDHMVNFMGMKLGPAIRMKLEIDKRKHKVQTSQRDYTSFKDP